MNIGENNNVHGTHHCHGEEPQVWVRIIEKVSAVALGAFSLYTSWQLFVPFFVAGVCMGVYSYSKNGESCHDNHSVSSCAHGLLEELTGVKLPRVVTAVIGIAVTVCHIDHHATVFVPVVGVSLGNWIGSRASHYVAKGIHNMRSNSSSCLVAN